MIHSVEDLKCQLVNFTLLNEDRRSSEVVTGSGVPDFAPDGAARLCNFRQRIGRLELEENTWTKLDAKFNKRWSEKTSDEVGRKEGQTIVSVVTRGELLI